MATTSSSSQQLPPRDDDGAGDKKKDGDGDNKGQIYDCNICLDTAKDAVISMCGHLFCWPCLHQWLETCPNRQTCPVCKAAIDKDKVIPVYGRGGGSKSDPRDKVPPRPQGQRTEPENNNTSESHMDQEYDYDNDPDSDLFFNEDSGDTPESPESFDPSLDVLDSSDEQDVIDAQQFSPGHNELNDDFSSDDSDSFSTPAPDDGLHQLSSMMGFFSAIVPWRDMSDFSSESDDEDTDSD